MGLIVSKESHLDHALTIAQLDWAKSVLEKLCDETSHGEVLVQTLQLPPELGTIPVSLVGPKTGGSIVPEESATYMVRGSRRWASRMTTGEPPQTRLLTIIAGPDQGEPCVLYTVYGGPQAPREPGDPSLKSWEEVRESRDFWEQHALLK